jgi:hypothetical protein
VGGSTREPMFWRGQPTVWQQMVSLSYEVDHFASYFDGETALRIETGSRRTMDHLRR